MQHDPDGNRDHPGRRKQHHRPEREHAFGLGVVLLGGGMDQL